MRPVPVTFSGIHSSTVSLRIPWEYRDGDRVQFVRDETCAREGEIRLVMMRGGAYGPLDGVEELIVQWYCHPESMVYVVTAGGHDHRIRSNNILGQFVSRDRWER